jgi:hypothetical protein
VLSAAKQKVRGLKRRINDEAGEPLPIAEIFF